MTRKNLTKRSNTMLVKNRAAKTLPLRLPKPSMEELRRIGQEMVQR